MIILQVYRTPYCLDVTAHLIPYAYTILTVRGTHLAVKYYSALDSLISLTLSKTLLLLGVTNIKLSRAEEWPSGEFTGYGHLTCHLVSKYQSQDLSPKVLSPKVRQILRNAAKRRGSSQI